MPDTGAPWNIPYVESTDLVSDWPADSLALANAIDAGLDAAGNAGIGSNVVSTTKTDVFTTTSTSYTPITGMSAAITPSSATSKVLVAVVVNGSMGTNRDALLQLKRGATVIGSGTGATVDGFAQVSSTYANSMFAMTIVYLDSPATTSATTYSVEAICDTAGTFYVNRRAVDTRFSASSHITLIEVAA